MAINFKASVVALLVVLNVVPAIAQRRQMTYEELMKLAEDTEQQSNEYGGSWATWKKGDLLGLDKNLPVFGRNEVEQFMVPLALKAGTGRMIKRKARTVF